MGLSPELSLPWMGLHYCCRLNCCWCRSLKEHFLLFKNCTATLCPGVIFSHTPISPQLLISGAFQSFPATNWLECCFLFGCSGFAVLHLRALHWEVDSVYSRNPLFPPLTAIWRISWGHLTAFSLYSLPVNIFLWIPTILWSFASY